jgi:hypothetical protein
MNSEEKVRATIISSLHTGRSVKESSITSKGAPCGTSNVVTTLLLLPEDFSSERKAHSRRSDAMDVSIVASQQDLVNQDPGRSMRSLARELGISEASVCNKMAQNIRYKSYRCGQFMKEATAVEQAQEASGLRGQWTSLRLQAGRRACTIPK